VKESSHEAPTYDGHDNIDVGTLDVSQERQDVVQNDHLVKTVQ